MISNTEIELEWNVKKIMQARAEHIEMYCAAFIKEAGPGSVRDWVLVEQVETNPETGVIQRVTWNFKRKTTKADRGE